MIIIELQALKQAAATRPPDYFDDVLSHADNITEHYIELSVVNYDKLCKKYRENHVTIYDQIRQTLRLQKAVPLQNKNLPGEVLLRFLRQFGFNVSADCPCRKKIALINARGVDWANENRAQIKTWLTEEAAHWGVAVSQNFAENLIARAFDFSRRHEAAQTQFTTVTNNG